MSKPMPNCSICKWSRWGEVFLFGRATGGQDQVCTAMGNKEVADVHNKRRCKKLFEVRIGGVK